MRLTCSDLKHILGSGNGVIYKGQNTFTNEPETRINLSGLEKEHRKRIKSYLLKKRIYLYQDDPVHLPFDYIATF